MKTEDEVYKFPISRILFEYGIVESRIRNLYSSPFQPERIATFHVDPIRNVWFDDVLGSGGTNVQLVQMLDNCPASDAVTYIRQLMAETARAVQQPAPRTGRAIEIVLIKDIGMRYLTEYIEGRGIPVATARMYCSELVTRNPRKNRRYNAVGFLNNNGGFIIRTPTGFRCTTKDGITTIDREGMRSSEPSSGAAAVFEGFFDFLSFLVMKGLEKPDIDVVVLNSTSNMSRAIAYLKRHSMVEAFLDNDESGRLCLKTMRTAMPGVSIIDRSALYAHYRDLNEMLVASLDTTPKDEKD